MRNRQRRGIARLRSPATIYDGIAQGRVDIGVIQGFTRHDECRGMTQKEAQVRFELLIK
jgi:hypothetical protein